MKHIRLFRVRRFPGILPLGALLILLCIWEALVVWLHLRTFILPRPSQVAVALFTQSHLLIPATINTAIETIAGFLLAAAIALPMAVLFVSVRWIEETLLPLIIAMQLIPKVALAPTLTVWLGLGMTTKLAVAALLSFFPILIDMMVGLKSIETGKILVARSMGASQTGLFFKIRLPNALPNLFAGLKVASTLAVTGAIVGEFIAAADGLGNLLLIASANFDMVTNLAAVTYLAVFGFLLFSTIAAIERFVLPWHISNRPDH